jgi:hypothetical protein
VKKIHILVYLVMQKGNPKRKIEVRLFSGYTLKNKHRNESKRDIFIDALIDKSEPITRGYKWFSVVPKDNNLIFRLSEQLGPKLGNIIGGALNRMSRPFSILLRVLFQGTAKTIWAGGLNPFWKATISVVGLVYKQTYLTLTKKSRFTPQQADQLAQTAARIFCNFMLTTRIAYELALYQSGMIQPEEPEERQPGEEAYDRKTLVREIMELDPEVARELRDEDPTTIINIKEIGNRIMSSFRRLRINQILEKLPPGFYQKIAYAFIVNSQNLKSINWTLYAKGTHAYTSIIAALTDIIIKQVKDISGIGLPMASEVGVAGFRKLRSRSFSDEMEYEEDIEKEDYFGKESVDDDEEETEEFYSDDDYMYDEDYEDEYTDDMYDEEESDYDEEFDEDYDDYDYQEGGGEEEEDYDSDYEEYDDEYDDEYEAADEGLEELIVPDLEPETSDYELPEYSESTQMELVYDEDEEDEQLVETLKSIEPSLNAFRLADKFLRTRSFSNSLSLKRKFYDFLVNEFVNTRAFNKKEEKEMKEAAAEIVDKLDTMAEDIKDIRTMLAKAIEAMNIATSDEGNEDSEQSDDSDSTWNDFWRSDDSSETDVSEGDEYEEEDEEVADDTSDESESDEEGEDEKGYKGYYARLRKYKKRGIRTLKKAAKPSKKPKTK